METVAKTTGAKGLKILERPDSKAKMPLRYETSSARHQQLFGWAGGEWNGDGENAEPRDGDTFEGPGYRPLA